MAHLEAWLRAFRLRTLPLSFSSIILGSSLALFRGPFKFEILLGALITTLFLQILSNLANDYGDFKSGVDNAMRLGPKRSLQNGSISEKAMKNAIIIAAVAALCSGLFVLWEAFHRIGIVAVCSMLVLGILAIAAAITYTVGSKPYGYRGLGDIAVFLFFGLVGVAGTFYLHTNSLQLLEILPAISIGLLATGVLNLNNIRDYEGDRVSGKRTLVVLWGISNAKIYHALLITLSMLAAVLYTYLRFQSAYQFIFLIVLPMLTQNVWVVFRSDRSLELDRELKKLALATFIFAITMGLGLNF